jgi:hypothetical protein
MNRSRCLGAVIVGTRLVNRVQNSKRCITTGGCYRKDVAPVNADRKTAHAKGKPA